MFEIDHVQSPPPLPAQPMLASDLLLLEQKQRKRFTGNSKLERIKTGCVEVDELLGAGLEDGGFERGVVLGISAGDEGRLISLNLLTTILIARLPYPSNPHHSVATIIDTTSSFPLSLLARILKSRLISLHLSTLASSSTKAQNQTANEAANHAVRKGGNEKRQLSAEEEKQVDVKVNRCLEMVALSRVFDIEGLWEVLGEIDVSRQDASSSVIPQQDHRGTGETRSQLEEETDKPETQAKETRKEERTEIEDSEDDDDLLLSLPSPQKPIEISLAKARTETQADIPKRGSLSDEKQQPRADEEDQGTEIIIVDNMTHLISELFGRKEKNNAHQLLTLLARHIHSLSKTKNILTILHNTTTSNKPSYNPSYPTPKQQKPTSNPSIFPSAPSKPSLGQLFASFPSLHLLISQLPKQREDAELLYAQDSDLPAPAADAICYCYVLEVLKDETPNLGREGGGRGSRFGAREQSWTAVEVNSEETGMTGVFQSRGDIKRGNLKRIRDGLASVGGVRDVGRMAKMQGGFGGRRV